MSSCDNTLNVTVPKIDVAVIFNDIRTERKFVDTFIHSSSILRNREHEVVTSLLRISFIKYGSQFCGKRFNFVYTTKQIANTAWFRTVIEPMLYGGVCEFPNCSCVEDDKE